MKPQLEIIHKDVTNKGSFYKEVKDRQDHAHEHNQADERQL